MVSWFSCAKALNFEWSKVLLCRKEMSSYKKRPHFELPLHKKFFSCEYQNPRSAKKRRMCQEKEVAMEKAEKPANSARQTLNSARE